eukprot:10020741-Ditylum_brightwellii.AAC.1
MSKKPEMIVPFTYADRNGSTFSSMGKSGPCACFCRKYGLDEKSHPADWFNALLPITPKDSMEEVSEVDVTDDKTTKFCIANWTSYTNAKERMANTSEEEHILQE